MKRIKLTQGKFTLVDDSDYEWLNQWKWCTRKASNQEIYYATRAEYRVNHNGIKVKAGTIIMHRLIMGLVKGDGMAVDHKDHDGLNNQRHNLRVCTYSQNSMNRRSQANSSSRFLGVMLNNCVVRRYSKKTKEIKEYTYQSWKSYISINGKDKYLGQFKTELEAAIIYNITARKYFGEFANPNKFN